MAERVERFDPEFDSAGEFPNGQSIVMDPYDEGDWVRFSDYERVEKERDELAAEAEDAIEARREIESKLESGYSFCHPEEDCEGQRVWLKAAAQRDELLEGIEAHRNDPEFWEGDVPDAGAENADRRDQQLYALADRLKGDTGGEKP